MCCKLSKKTLHEKPELFSFPRWITNLGNILPIGPPFFETQKTHTAVKTGSVKLALSRTRTEEKKNGF